jgi:pimeloyl-ACP methyl ester carboxylesterase
LAYELSAITGDVQTIADAQTQALIDCHDDLVETAHLSSYTSAQNAADIADLRRVLGIEEWNVFGVSYGTRLALTLMRDDPEGVRSVVLDSVYPPQVDLFGEFAANLQAAFERLFTACAQDEACNEAYPDLQTVFFELVERLNANPAHITAIHTIGNFQYSAYVNGDMVLNEVFGQMYVRARIPDLPRLIYDAYNGWEELLASAAQSFLDESYGISEGMYYSIECGEETPFTDWDAAYEDMNALPPALSLDTFLPSAQAICDAWMTNTPDSIENAPVVSDIPTLLLNGEFDPITPVRWAEDTAGYLSNSYFYIMPATGHGVVRSTDCGIGIMLAFLNDLTTAPDASCIDTVGGVDWVLP